MTTFHFMLGAFFQIKALQAPFLPKFPPKLAQISPNLPKRATLKHDLQKKQKKACALILGAIFVKSKHTQWFCESFHTFCPNFHRFCPDFKDFCADFNQIKRFVVRLHLLHPLHPRLLHQCMCCLGSEPKNTNEICITSNKQIETI